MKIVKNIKKESFFIVFFIFVLSFLFSMQSNLNIWYLGETSTDSSVFKNIGLLMTKGYIPYLDTFDHKGPLIYIYNWLGTLISYWRGVWLIELASLFFAFLMTYKISRLYCGRLFSLIALLIYTSLLFKFFEGGNLVEEYAMPFIAVSLYIFTDYFRNKKINAVRLIVCGFSLGAVLMLRPNMISLWIVFCAAALVRCVVEKNYSQLLRFIAFFLGGLSLILIPITIWLISNGAFTDFIRDYITFNLMYSSGNITKRAILANKYKSFSVFLNELLVLLSFLVLLYQFKMKKNIFNAAYILYFILTLLLICMSGMTFGHYGIVLIPMISSPISFICGICEKEFRKNNSITTLVVIAYFLASIALPKWIGSVDKAVEYYSTRDKNHISSLVTDVVNIVKNNTDEEDRITVWGNWNIIYVLSGRVPASKYSYQFPIGDVNPMIFDEYFKQIESNLPELIIIQPGKPFDGGMEEFINKYNYDLVYNSNTEKNALVYKKSKKE